MWPAVILLVVVVVLLVDGPIGFVIGLNGELALAALPLNALLNAYVYYFPIVVDALAASLLWNMFVIGYYGMCHFASIFPWRIATVWLFLWAIEKYCDEEEEEEESTELVDIVNVR